MFALGKFYSFLINVYILCLGASIHLAGGRGSLSSSLHVPFSLPLSPLLQNYLQISQMTKSFALQNSPSGIHHFFFFYGTKFLYIFYLILYSFCLTFSVLGLVIHLGIPSVTDNDFQVAELNNF